MNENELKNKIRKLGYKCLFGIDYHDGNEGIQIIPKKYYSEYSDGASGIDRDLVNLLKNYGFEFDSLIEINGKIFALFKKGDGK